MDSGAPDSAGLEAWSLLNHSSSDREEVISTLINPSQPDTAVTPCVSTTSHLAGDIAAPRSSGSSNFAGGEMHAEEKPRPGSTGVRGITRIDHLLPGSALYTEMPSLVSNRVGGFYNPKKVYTDSFPSDEWWMPPLHGEDVPSLSNNLVNELDVQRHDYSRFTRILEAHGCECSNIKKEFLLSFQDEKELQLCSARCASGHGIGGTQTSEQTDIVSAMRSTASAFFPFNNHEKGRVVQPNTEELESCLNGISEDFSAWKSLFMSSHNEAVGAVESLDWEMACEQYEACLVLLEDMERSIGIHIQTWLCLWVCIPLATIYHLRRKEFSKCVKIYDQVLQQLNREIDTLHARNQKGKTKEGYEDEGMDQLEASILLHYTIIWHRRLVLFEWSYAFEKDGNQLLANYVRSKVFQKVKVQATHFVGYVQLQRMINCWGRRGARGREGDMRVALCFNLEHLYRESNQQLDAAEWTKEKWRWICEDTHELEEQWNLKLEDVTFLFSAGMVDEAQSLLGDLEGCGHPLPPTVSNKIASLKVEFFMEASQRKVPDGQQFRNLPGNDCAHDNHELEEQWNLKLEDVMSLFKAGKIDEAESVIGILERCDHPLPPIVSDVIDYWKAKFLMESNRPKESDGQLSSLEHNAENLEKFKEGYTNKSLAVQESEWWKPPLHGGDVASLSNNTVKELDEQRHDYAEFTRILEAHGCQCSGIEKEFLLSFQDEKELQLCGARRANGLKIEGDPQTSKQAGVVSIIKCSVAAVFSFSWDQGRIVRPNTAWLESCLNGISEDFSAWKSLFMSSHNEAVGAVESLDWEMACEQYEACLVLLEDMERSIGIHIQTWLCLWVCIPLATIYHLRRKEFSKCVKIYDQVLQQLTREMNSLSLQNEKGEMKVVDEDGDVYEDGAEHDGLVVLYFTMIWHRRLVLFEWSYAFEKGGNQLLANYVRSKVFQRVKVQEIQYFLGYVQLQRLINYWGRRNARGREGDMRVALCFNLEHLYRKSNQQLDAVGWTKEKWRWICDDTHELEEQWNLKLDDVMSLFSAGMKMEAQSTIGELESKLKKAPESNFSPTVSHTIDYWKAKFLMESNRLKEAKTSFQKLQSSAPKGSKLLALIQYDMSKLESSQREAEMLEYCSVGVEMTDWSDANDISVLSAMADFKRSNAWKEISENSGRGFSGSCVRPNITHGQQLLNSLGKRFAAKEIETYRDRLYDAMRYFEDALRSIQAEEDALQFRDEVITPEEIVATRQRISRYQSFCHELLGTCCVYAHKYKTQGVKYNVEDLKKELPVFDEACLEKGIRHLKKALDLAEKSQHDGFLISQITAKLGWIHFEKVKEYHDRVQKFLSLIPKFISEYSSRNEWSRMNISMGAERLSVKYDCGNTSHDHIYDLILGQELLQIGQKQKASTDPDNAFSESGILTLRGYRGQIGLSKRPFFTDEDLKRTLKECAGLLLRGLMTEIKRSTAYVQKSLEMGYGRIQKTDVETTSSEHDAASPELDTVSSKLDATSSKHELVPSLSMIETTKKIFTLFQHLMVHEHNIREALQKDCLLHEIITGNNPEIAEYLRSQAFDLTPSQKALICAERGRSRSLMHQLLTNKVPEEPINKVADFNMTDQEAWAILEATRLSFGKNTVFVQYTFDSTYEFKSDITGTANSNYDWKSCKWIVYVVTKKSQESQSTDQEGEVHMRSYQTTIPATSVALIHKYMSKPEDQTSHDMVKNNLETLYNAFIEPVSDLLERMKPADKLVFGLDEVLTNVPFPILRNSKTGKYLFENHTISFTPALRVLVHCGQRYMSSETVQESRKQPLVAPSLALGDPKYQRSRERLPGTLAEINCIRELFNEVKVGSVEILTGAEATPHNLLHHARLPFKEDMVQGFVHVAAHNHVDKKHKSGSLQLAYSMPESSSKLRCKEKGRMEKIVREESFLSSEKIMQCGFEWRCNLVVLSACNSAKGYVLGSEGVVGLPRAFLVAGVPCVVASQWKVEDGSSSELMLEFYKEMREGSDASSALQAAMLRKMKPDETSDHLIDQVDVCKYGGFLVWGVPTVTLPSNMIKHSSVVNQGSGST